MERLKKARGVLRATISRTITGVEVEVALAVTNQALLEARKTRLGELKAELMALDSEINTQMLDADAAEDVMIREAESQEEYIEKINLAIISIERKVRPRAASPTSSVYSSAASNHGRKTYKLPKVEIKKFNGEIMEWLSWWHQFQRIDGDDDLHNTDKFQYLAQAVVEKSKAEDVIRAYPQTGANYPKAVQALKERFGDTKILKRVYVRELLKMIIHNSRGVTNLSSTYDKLEGHLKALESLGITPDQMDVILYPMVESCLPDDILVAWQRSPLFGKEDKTKEPPVTEFHYLLEFVKKEVKNQGQREMARQGFGVVKKEHNQGHRPNRGIPTAASLLNNSDRTECLFCSKLHPSLNCFKAKKMSMEERKSAIKTNNGCFKCLKKGHYAKVCRGKVNCSVCSGPHLHILCASNNQHDEGERNSRPTQNGTEAEGVQVANNANHISRGMLILMKTLLVRVRGQNGRTKVARLLFDDGSQLSYVKKTVAKEIGCKPMQSFILQNNLFGGIATKDKAHQSYQVELESLDNKEKRKLTLVDELVICQSCPSIPKGDWIEELAQEGIFLTDTSSESTEVEILIGSDLWGNLMTGRMKKLRCGLTAMESIFGWTISGEVSRQATSNCAISLISMLTQGEKTIQQMWSLEALGIRDKAEQITQEEHDYQVKGQFQNKIARGLDGRYVVELPWIDSCPKLPTNRGAAERRLQRATEKLVKEEQFATYNNIFKSWEEEGIIEVHVELEDDGHFLPHRPVFKPNSLTTPVRPVFDASCKVGKNPSLNQCLEKGPNMLELIPSILLRFREKTVGVTADIRKAFQMIGVSEKDRNYQKFLWWEDDICKKFKIYKHSRVVFGLNCSPFMFAAVLEHHMKLVSPENKAVADLLMQSLYVDNVVTSFDDTEELQDFKSKSVAIFEDAKMDLRQWETNSRGLEDSLPVSVLGLIWNKYEDTLGVQVPEIKDEGSLITKRKVLSVVSQVYDPIGFTCPTMLYPKIMLQDSWAASLDWDKPWEEEKSKTFISWLQELSQLSEVRIPRQAFAGNSRGLVQLHLFCDASKSAYGAVIFARVKLQGNVSVQLLQAKSRLSPLDKKKKKTVSIPRLELMGCLVGSRLLQSVKEALSLADVPVYLWSDSSIALAWIRRDEDWGTFVGNRSREINKLTKAKDWKHVPGHLNPADLPSRGCTPSQLVDSRWWEGPSWLKLSEEDWPSQEEQPNEEEVHVEVKKTGIVAIAAASLSNTRYPWFSSYLKNVRLLGWMRRVIENSRRKQGNRVDGNFLSLDKLRIAEKDVIRRIQRNNTALNKVKNLKTEKGEDGIIHVKSRLILRELENQFRYPILLPKDDPIVHQLIEYVHKSNCHAGTQFVLGRLREKFWIISGRKTVARIIHKCIVCKRHSAKKMTCEQGPLPINRTKIQAAFETTGVDLAGPIILKGGKKAWVVIYTCAIYRGVHFDVVNSISSDEFLDSLEKFTWIIGNPNNIYSDNGTNFVGASRLLKSVDLEKA